MANITLNALYDQKQREFNVLGSGTARFQADFIIATNRAINQINREGGLSSAITRIDSIEDDVALDEEYEDVLSDGISLYLHFTGSRPAKGAEMLIPALSARFKEGIGSIYTDVKNDEWEDDNTAISIGITDMY